MPAVLDASGVLALFLGEPVSDAFLEAVDEGALLSAVNLAEIATKLTQWGEPMAAIDVADAAHVAVVPFLEEQAIRAGELETAMRPFGLSLGDRCCLAVAEAFDAQVWTADRAWLELPSPWRERVVCVRPE